MIATALGSFDGTDMATVMRTLLGELEQRAPIAELPARGPHAGMIARTAAMLPETPFDLRPSGWRLSQGDSLVRRRAASLVTDDVTITAEVVEDWSGVLTLTMAGPWTLLANLDLPRGGKAVGDWGARRDLCQAWLAGAAAEIDHARAQLGRPLAIQIDEPSLPQVLAGKVPDESGRRMLPPVEPHEVNEALANCVSTARESSGDIVVIHCCGDSAPVDEMGDAAPDALSVDTSRLSPADWQWLAQWLDSGRQLWLGLLPTNTPTAGPGAIAEALMDCRRALDAEPGGPADDRLTLTPACGLAGVSFSSAMHAVTDLVRVARDQ